MNVKKVAEDVATFLASDPDNAGVLLAWAIIDQVTNDHGFVMSDEEVAVLDDLSRQLAARSIQLTDLEADRGIL